jgi:hypothetical protein
MMELAAPALDSNTMEFSGGTHSRQRRPKAGLRGLDMKKPDPHPCVADY